MSTITRQQMHELILEAVQELVSEIKFKKKRKKDKEFHDPRIDPLSGMGRNHDKLLLLDDEPKETGEEVEILELDATLEDGTPVCEGCLVAYMNEHKDLMLEAKYKGREVPLGKPMKGDVKKSKVYVRNPKTGKIVKVNFGDKKMRIKKSNPKRRKSFRARHNCKNPGPRTKAKFWSCRAWE